MKLSEAFSHPREADAAAMALPKAPKRLGRNAVAIIRDQQNCDIVFATNVNDYAFRSGMAVDVRQSFLENAKESDLRILVKPIDKIINVEINFETAPLRETFHVPAGCGI